MSENPLERLKTHNTGKVKSTKAHRPFRIIYTEVCKDRAYTREREKYLKSAAGRRFIKNHINSSEGSLPD